MLGEIEVAACGDAFEFFAHQLAFFVPFAEREFVQDINSGSGVVSKFFRLLPIFNERGAWQANVFVETESFFDPILVPHLPTPVRLRFAGMAGAARSGDAAENSFGRFVWSDEKLEFHLLEFAGAECEIARIDFVSKSFADLANAEWNFLA